MLSFLRWSSHRFSSGYVPFTASGRHHFKDRLTATVQGVALHKPESSGKGEGKDKHRALYIDR